MKVPSAHPGDPRMALLAMLQVVVLMSSLVLVPGLTLAESAPEGSEPAVTEVDESVVQATEAPVEPTLAPDPTPDAEPTPAAATPELAEPTAKAAKSTPEPTKSAAKAVEPETSAEKPVKSGSTGSDSASTARSSNGGKPKAKAAPEVTIRLYPKKVRLYPAGKAVVSAWTCPAADRSPFGKDRVPGTGDDECSVVRAKWSVKDPARAHLSNTVGYKTRITLDKFNKTKLIAQYDGLERRAQVLVKDRPAKIRPAAEAASKAPRQTEPPTAEPVLEPLAEEPSATPLEPGVVPSEEPESTAAPSDPPPADPSIPPADPSIPPADPSIPPAGDGASESEAQPSAPPSAVPSIEPSLAPAVDASPEPSADPITAAASTEQVVTRVFAPAANEITVKSHAGQRPDGTWTSGNVAGYAEGQTINFRFALEATAPGAGSFEIRYTATNGCQFFAQSFGLGNTGAFPAPPLVPAGSDPTVTLGSNTLVGNEWVQVVNVSFAAAGTVTGYYYLTFAATAGGCSANGASAIDGETGAVQVSGQQTVPVSGTITALPEISVVKQIDEDRDGTADRPAAAGEYEFCLTPAPSSHPSPSNCLQTDASGSVQWTNVSPGGTYDIDETQVDLSTGVYQFAQGTGTLNCTFSGDTATVTVAAGRPAAGASCTFLNEAAPGTLIVRKVVVNDDGGTATAGQFAFSIAPDPDGEGTVPFGQGNHPDFPGDDGYGQNSLTLPAGTYTVTENVVQPGYSVSYDNCSDVALDPGETEICTVTNDDAAAQLTIVKLVTNDDGGTATVADFNIATDAGGLIFDPGDGGSPTTTYTATTLTVTAGTYTLSEDDVDGYTEGNWVCDNGDGGPFDDGQVTLDNGDDVTCQIENSDQSAVLEIFKVIVNDDGGSATVSDFGITSSAGALTFDGGVSAGPDSTLYTARLEELSAGTYTLAELDVDGYAEGTWECSNDAGTTYPFDAGEVTLGNGESVVCGITNDDAATGAIVVEKATDPAGGTGFTFNGDAAGTIDDGETITVTDLPAGTYTSTELVPDGWALTDITCDDADSTGDIGTATATFNVDNGETVTCTFTNTRDATLTVAKNVVNDDGGSATVTDFGITTSAGTLTWDGGDGGDPTTIYRADPLTVSPGTYTLSELELPTYDEGSWWCQVNGGVWVDSGPFDAGSVTINEGESVLCAIVNDDRPGSIIVEKATDPAGGTGFTFNGDAAGTIDDGETITVTDLPAGTYTSTELVPDGWALTDITCDDADSTGDTGTATATFNVDNGETVTCTFTNTALATITVEKATDPAGGTGFGFSADGPFGSGDFTLDDGGTQVLGSLPPGETYTFTESSLPATDPAWALTDITCVGTDGAVVDLDTDSVAVTPAAGEDITCTFTNVQQGAIVIEKSALGGDDTFDFFSSPDLPGTSAGAFSLTTSGGSASQSFDVAPGVWGVQELDPPAGWTFTSLACSDEDDASGGSVVTGSAAAVDVQPGETVTCTFTNTALATITVEKATDPAGGTGFTFNGDVAGTIDDGETITVTDLPAGTYTSTETVPAGWTLADITCDDDDSTGDTGSATATFNVTPGETVTCTFTNWALSVIVVEKVTDPAGDTTFFDFTTDAGAPFSLADGESHQLTSLEPGNYSVSESVSAGWTLEEATCDNGDDPDSITLGPDEVVTCTFTNVADRGSITIAKVTDPSPDPTGTSFTFTGDVTGSIGDGESIVVTGVRPGTFTSTEVVPAGWTLADIDCDDADSTGDVGDATATIRVAPGEDVTCTFTNVAGDVAMTVGKSADATTVPDTGADVTFTFTVRNVGDVPFGITSLEDSVYGTLDGDADCQVGTVLEPGESCSFEETFTVEPSVTPDPSDPDQVIPDHRNTFESCSILSDEGPAPAAFRSAAVTDCADDSVVIAFRRTEVEAEGLPPTDMLPRTDGAGPGWGGSQPLLPWLVFTLLAAAVIVGGGVVVRRSREAGI